MSKNVFSCTGRLGRDAEVRHTPAGQSVLSVAIATDTGYGDSKKTLWISASLWGKQAEGSLVDYLKKGQEVFVSGELSQRDYEKDGVTKTTLELRVGVIDLIGGKRDDGQQQSQSYQQKPIGTPYSAPAQNNRQASTIQKPSTKDNFDEFNDDIPF